MSSIQAKIVKFVKQKKVKIERAKKRKTDLQEIEIMKLAQKDFKMIINILKSQKMGIIGKNIKKFQEKIGSYFKNKIQINKIEEH